MPRISYQVYSLRKQLNIVRQDCVREPVVTCGTDDNDVHLAQHISMYLSQNETIAAITFESKQLGTVEGRSCIVSFFGWLCSGG